MTHPRRALLEAHLAADKAGQPWLASTSRGVLVAVILGLVRDSLDPFQFATFAVTLLMALVALALVGDWAHLLRSGEEEDWLASLPASDTDRRVARALHVMALVLFLSLPSALLAAIMIPDVGFIARGSFLVGLLGSAIFTAACLSLAIPFSQGRLESVWITFQAFGLGFFVWGLVEALGRLSLVNQLPELGEAGWTWGLPPAWFASPASEGTPALWRLAFPLAPTLLASFVLMSAPVRRASDVLRRSWLDALLTPARALAARTWVGRKERATFDLVYDAFPREREVVLRSYPLIALPMVFLVLALSGEDDAAARDDFLSVVLFGAALYLPILVSQVPVSRSWRARWILDTAPTSFADQQLGACKAIIVRFVLPLYLLFAILTVALVGPLAVLRLTVPAFCVATLAVIRLWPVCVMASPLSESPDEFTPSTAWYASLLGWTFGFTILGILVERKVTLPFGTLVLLVLVGLAIKSSEHRLRRLFDQIELANSASASSSG